MNPYDEDYGPDAACAATIRDSSPITQSALYEELTSLYNLTDKLESGCDYFKVATVLDTEYYDANNETWGSIIAVSHEHKLALSTGFYEMDDMEDPRRGYSMVVKNGKLDCIE